MLSLAMDRADQRHEAVHVLSRHAGHRLVEQDHVGIAREQFGELQLALITVRERPLHHAARSASPTRASAHAARSSAGRNMSARTPDPSVPPRVASAASRTFSNALSRGKTLEI